MKTTQRGFIVPFLLVIIALFLAGSGAYVYTKTKQVNPPAVGNVPVATSTTQTVAQTTPTTKNSSSQTADWKTYTNSKYGFSFKYPPNWFIRESINSNEVDFAKSELARNDTTTKIFASFYVSYLTLKNPNDEGGGSAPLVTLQEYFNYYHPVIEDTSLIPGYTPGTIITREWLTISNIPVFHRYFVGTDSRYAPDSRYSIYTSNKVYGFAVYKGTAQQPTTYEQKDNDLIQQMIATLHDNSNEFIKVSN